MIRRGADGVAVDARNATCVNGGAPSAGAAASSANAAAAASVSRTDLIRSCIGTWAPELYGRVSDLTMPA